MSQQGNDSGQGQGPVSMRFGDLKKLIADSVAELVGKGQQQLPSGQNRNLQGQVRDSRGSGPARSVDDEVSAALKKIEEDNKRKARDEGIDKDLTELKERTKEKPPVERRRVHRLMGWGE